MLDVVEDGWLRVGGTGFVIENREICEIHKRGQRQGEGKPPMDTDEHGWKGKLATREHKEHRDGWHELPPGG
jgi:hypothetical protein